MRKNSRDRLSIPRVRAGSGEQYPEFCPIKDGAEALKHVRLAKRDGEVIYSSTGITPSDPTTRVLDNGQKRLELRDVLDKAASILSSVC